jgi:Glycosyltransferase family 25 (LPS biosynthesis protein)
MQALDRLFPQKFCINLRRRPDRWDRMLHQFRRHDIRGVIRHDAVDGRELTPPAEWTHGRGAYGCLLSHLELVRKAQENRLPAVLIFEDDVVFHDDFQERFEEYSARVPEDWDAIFMGGIHIADPAPISPGVAKLTEAFSTYAYGLRNKAYAAFLSDAQTQKRPVDHTTREMQRDFRFYCFTPHLAWVTEDYSDIHNSAVNHWWLKDDAVGMNGKDIQKMLTQTVAILRMPDANWRERNPEIVQCVSYFYSRINIRIHFIEDALADAASISALLETGDEYVVISDAGIHPYMWEFKASLLKCLEFDRVLPENRAIPLNKEDTGLVMRTLIHNVDTLRYDRVENDGHRPEFCIYSRAGLSMGEPRTFRSPNRLVRLHP